MPAEADEGRQATGGGGRGGQTLDEGSHEQHVDASTEDRPGTVSASCPQPHSFGPSLDGEPMSKDHFRFRILQPRDCHFKKDAAAGAGAEELTERFPAEEQRAPGVALLLRRTNPHFSRTPNSSRRKPPPLPCAVDVRVKVPSPLFGAAFLLQLRRSSLSFQGSRPIFARTHGHELLGPRLCA